MPETFMLKVSEGICKKPVVADDKRIQAKQHLRKRGENQQRKQDSKMQRREQLVAQVFAAVRLHAHD